ncbi:MAG: hypothetical protein ACLFT9_13965 [Coleofasciculus sp.]
MSKGAMFVGVNCRVWGIIELLTWCRERPPDQKFPPNFCIFGYIFPLIFFGLPQNAIA